MGNYKIEWRRCQRRLPLRNDIWNEIQSTSKTCEGKVKGKTGWADKGKSLYKSRDALYKHMFQIIIRMPPKESQEKPTEKVWEGWKIRMIKLHHKFKEISWKGMSLIYYLLIYPNNTNCFICVLLSRGCPTRACLWWLKPPWNDGPP